MTGGGEINLTVNHLLFWNGRIGLLFEYIYLPLVSVRKTVLINFKQEFNEIIMILVHSDSEAVQLSKAQNDLNYVDSKLMEMPYFNCSLM